MRLTLLENSYLYEGLDRRTTQSMMLWESAGQRINEAALTADQIKQIFSQIEQDAVAAGGSRTIIGKGKDATMAVNAAWEDLKTKIQNSGPIKGFDQKVSDALSKIGVGAKDPEFNGQVNKWVQKYRDFAEKHPIAQGAIYATLIALAGISGAGVGGAAALGLLKMADKLLQGERFSSAAYAGAKTGIMAFAASKLGDYLKDKWNTYSDPSTEEYYVNGQQVDKATYEKTVGEINQSIKDAKMDMDNFKPSEADIIARKVISDDPTLDSMAKAQDLRGALAGDTSFATDPNLNPVQQKLAAIIDSGKPLNQNQLDFLDKAIDKAALKANMVGDTPDGSANQFMKQFMSLQAMRNAAKVESYNYNYIQTRPLSEGQVYLVFNQIIKEAGFLDKAKELGSKAAGAVAGGASWLGKQATEKITSAKLTAAWKLEGSPTDSEDLRKFLLDFGGIDPKVIEKIYTDMNLSVGDQNSQQSTTKTQTAYQTVKNSLNKLNNKDKTRLISYLKKSLGTV